MCEQHLAFNIVWAATETMCLHFFFHSYSAGWHWCWRWCSFGIQSPHMDPWQAGLHVYGLHLQVHPNVEETSLPCVWKGEASVVQHAYCPEWGRDGRAKKVILVLYSSTRLCANLAPPMNSLSNIKRTSLLECVTSVSKFFWSRKANRPIHLEKELRLLSTKSRSWYPQPSKR